MTPDEAREFARRRLADMTPSEEYALGNELLELKQAVPRLQQCIKDFEIATNEVLGYAILFPSAYFRIKEKRQKIRRTLRQRETEFRNRASKIEGILGSERR